MRSKEIPSLEAYENQLQNELFSKKQSGSQGQAVDLNKIIQLQYTQNRIKSEKLKQEKQPNIAGQGVDYSNFLQQII